MRFSIELTPKLSKIDPSSARIANEPNAGFLSLGVGLCRTKPLRDPFSDRVGQPFWKPQRRFALGQKQRPRSWQLSSLSLPEQQRAFRCARFARDSDRLL